MGHVQEPRASLCPLQSYTYEGCVVGSTDLSAIAAGPGVSPLLGGCDFPAYLANLSVAEDLRGRGLATALVGAAREQVRAWGARALFTHADEEAVGFYLGLGFVPEAGGPEIPGAVLMRDSAFP